MYYSMLKITPAYYSVSVEVLKQSWHCRNIAVGVEVLFTVETLKHIENNHLIVEIATMFNLLLQFPPTTFLETLRVKFLFGQGICGRGRQWDRVGRVFGFQGIYPGDVSLPTACFTLPWSSFTGWILIAVGGFIQDSGLTRKVYGFK